MSYHPTSELVAVAWLKGVTGIGNNVSTELPADNASWAASGWTQVLGAGGSPDIYLPISQPVISVDTWAVGVQSSKPPWAKANQLAEIIKRATLDHASVPRLLVLPDAYANARCLNVIPLTEPRKIRSDPADYAHWSMDVQFNWVEVPK